MCAYSSFNTTFFYLTSIDFKAAFDSISQAKFWERAMMDRVHEKPVIAIFHNSAKGMSFLGRRKGNDHNNHKTYIHKFGDGMFL